MWRVAQSAFSDHQPGTGDLLTGINRGRLRMMLMLVTALTIGLAAKFVGALIITFC